jgi:hypothetical protein
MKRTITTTAIMMARVCGLVALVQGAAYWAGFNLPLYVHIALGSLFVFALWSLAFQARLLATGLALTAVASGTLVPVLGIVQLQNLLGEFHWVLQWLHLAAGLGSIAFAEILAKRLRLSARVV